MARELDEGELSRLEEDAASSRAESESGFTGSGSAYSDEVSTDAFVECRKVPSVSKLQPCAVHTSMRLIS